MMSDGLCSSRSSGTLVLRLVTHQVDVARVFWRDRRFQMPMLTIWVASFGGALHSPVTTYYYKAIGASTTDIGTIGFLSSLVFVRRIYRAIKCD